MNSGQFRSFHLVLATLILYSCQKSQTATEIPLKLSTSPLFQIENLVAWCVVPFDSLNRGPQERAKMLRDLGFKKFAYDWREQHLSSFPAEVDALKGEGIELTSVWWWIDGQEEDLLYGSNQQLLDYMDSLDISCDIWMSFDDRFFEGLDDSQKLNKAVEVVKVLHEKAANVGSRLQLYNHGAWFGDPRNQVRIIEKSGLTDMGIVYNFHHGHHQIEEFPELLKIMQPYLNTVNINGMTKEGPKILTVGEGVSEKEMLKTLANSGFKGNIGIIGHLENEDVRVVLQRNLQGLQEIVSEF